jgi:hypothetical protein
LIMGNVYIWKEGKEAVCHTSLEAAALLDGLSRPPDKTVTEEQFSEAGCLARIIGGKIALGGTAKEAADEAARKRIAEIDARFAEIERELVRPITAHVRGNPEPADADKLETLGAEAQELRAERAEAVQSLDIPY